MKNLFANTALLTLTLCLSTVADFTSSRAYAQDTAAAAVTTVDVDPAMWVVKDEDTTIYLFGTVHVLKPGLGWFDDAVKMAFDSSDQLVLELVEPDPAAMQGLIMAMAVDPSGGLRGKLNVEQKVSYEKALTGLGMPVAALDVFEPWMAGVTLTTLPLMKAGYDMESGAEKVLSKAATGKEIIGLETPEQQLGFFDTLPEANQIAFLTEVTDGIDEVTRQIDELVVEWGNGNPDKLAEMMNASFTDQLLRETLLDKRNANWAQWVKTRLDTPGTVFLAVGAGHLAGAGSLQDQLLKLDIKSERVEY